MPLDASVDVSDAGNNARETELDAPAEAASPTAGLVGMIRTAMAASSRLDVRLLCYCSAQYLSEMNWTSNGLTCAWKT